MILHDMPDDRIFLQKEWIDHMLDKKYEKESIQNIVSSDFRKLIKSGTILIILLAVK